MCLAPSLTRGKEAKRKKMAEWRSQRRLAVPCEPRGYSCLLLLVSRRPRAGRRDFSNKLLARAPRSQDHTTAIRIWRCDTSDARLRISKHRTKFSGAPAVLEENQAGIGFNTEGSFCITRVDDYGAFVSSGSAKMNLINEGGLGECGPRNKI